VTASDHEFSDLLGAYALDAVEPDEARRIEEHLATCPKCRAEVAAYRETASYLAYAGTDAPEGVWARIGAEIGLDQNSGSGNIPDLATVRMDRSRTRHRRRAALTGVATTAAAALIVLGVEVAHLNGQVSTLQRAALRQTGLAPLVLSALESPHQTVSLTSATTSTTASVVVTRDGSAYWVGSTLERLPGSRTYQLWGKANGHLVSLALLGSAPQSLSMFRIQSGISTLMVTNEPKGGTAAPTTPALLSGPVPSTL
jgi:hypothetical protein